jgi:hypothetical protein
MKSSFKIAHRDQRRRFPAIAAAWALTLSLLAAALAPQTATAIELDLKPQIGLELSRTSVQYYVPFDCSAISDTCDVEVTGFGRHFRLEVQNVSCYGKVTDGDVLYFNAAAIANSGDYNGIQFFPATFVADTTTRIFTGGDQTFFLVGPRAKLYLRVQATKTKDIAEAECTVAGDLVFF